LLIQMVDVYERSFEPPGRRKKGAAGRRRRPPEPRAATGEAALPQLVAHGFLNIPPKLIQALRALNGGNLRWLGSREHEPKDFMHFELKEPTKLW
jgi:hypothetical protein